MLSAPGRWWSGLSAHGQRGVLVATLLLFVYGFVLQRPAWNEYSRYDLVRAIVEQGTTRIDSFHENTGDKAFYEGHWYSDKAPGSAALGVPAYAALHLTSELAGRGTPSQVDAVGALAFVESGVTTTILVLLLISFLRPHVGESWAVGVGCAYGLGSMALPFATMFFGHAASTAALFGAFFLLHRQAARPRRWIPVAAGFLAGWAVLIEIPAILGVAVLGLYSLRLGRPAVLGYVVGGIPPALAFGLYNAVSFGSPLSIGYMNLLPGGFASGMSEGILGVGWPRIETLGQLLFGERGLIRLAPWFILAPLGLLAVRRRGIGLEVVVCATIVILFVGYNAGYYLPFGGWTPGPRFLLPALPFAAVLVALIPRWARIAAVPLMLVGAAIFLVATVTMPNAPERVVDPLLNLWLPRLAAGGFAETGAWIRWGLAGGAPIVVLLLGLGFGLLALGLSLRRATAAASITARGSLALALLAVACSLPFPPFAPVAVGWGGDPGSPEISIVEVGQMPIRGADAGVELWARIENRGGEIGPVRLQFSLYRENGEGVWSAWYGDETVGGASRRTIWMSWLPDDAPGGRYRYGFAVSDAVSGETYARVLASEVIDFGP